MERTSSGSKCRSNVILINTKGRHCPKTELKQSIQAGRVAGVWCLNRSVYMKRICGVYMKRILCKKALVIRVFLYRVSERTYNQKSDDLEICRV